jgi:deferrochelatase/peroxidase EfeB
VSAPLSFADDARGERCPLGAHVRRASPRDGLAIGAERSLAATAARRLLRRGRVYGTPAPAPWLPHVACGEEERPESDDATERGLLFVALCADLARQYEFVQQTWLNDPKHADLFDEVDPISAGDAIEGEQQRFTIPREGLRRRLCDVTRWVTVRGGGYFLLPSKSALRSLLA